MSAQGAVVNPRLGAVRWRADALHLAARQATRLAFQHRADLALLLACVAGVVAIRVQLLGSTDFPVNDGALFLAFVQAIVPVFPGIPQTVEFSGLTLPFAYPPLSFWLSAAAVRLGADPLQIVHQVPILMNIGYVMLFALLLRRTGHSRLFTAVAVLVFGSTFLAYEWLVMGGGLSRGLGSLLLLLTLLIMLPPAAGKHLAWPTSRLVAAGLCVGASVLAHLEWGILSGFSALVCLLLARPRAATLGRALLVLGGTAALVVLPWFWTVYTAHGIEPFVAASRTGSLQRVDGVGGVGSGVSKVVQSFSVLLPFMLLGGVCALRTRDRFWLLFLVAALLLTPRGGRTPAMLALGVLTASGLLTSFVLLRQWASARRRHSVLVAAALVGCVLLGVRTADGLRRNELFAVLPPELRAAMEWVARHHPGGRFAVLNEAPWYYNAAAEWFPLLAQAVNTTTVQGREWLPGHDFRRAELAVKELNASTSCTQLLRSLDGFSRHEYVWVEGGSLLARGRVRDALHGPGTLAACFDAAGYEEVLSNPRVRIFRDPRHNLLAIGR